MYAYVRFLGLMGANASLAEYGQSGECAGPQFQL